MEPGLRSLLLEGARRLGAPLDDVAVARFDRYLALLQAWGRRINLTSRLHPREIVLHHFLDSLAGAPWIGGGEGGSLLDIGSGAGFPGLPLKIARPELRVVLLDSVRKKVAFCRQVILETGLSDIVAEWGRAEERGADSARSGVFTRVVSRAVARSADLVVLGVPFLAPGGEIILYKGKPDRGELDELAALCARRGLAHEAHPVTVPGLDATRTILRVFRTLL